MTDDGQSAAERAVRTFFTAYNEQQPELFDDVVSPEYLDYGHNPPGRGPQGARDDFEQAKAKVGPIDYQILSLVDDQAGHVAVHWTGKLGSGQTVAGLSLYGVEGGLITSTHHAAEGGLPG